MKIYNTILAFSICLLILITGGDALAACSDLQLLSNGADYGSLSCDANGYVVANDPTGKPLTGYTVNTEVVTGKSRISGFTYSNNPADKKGKTLVTRKDNQSRDVVFVCNQSKTQAAYGGSDPFKLNAVVTPVSSSSEEMKFSVFEMCLLSEPTQFQNNDLVFEPTLRNAAIDTNESYDDGFQPVLKFTKNDWQKAKFLVVYFGKDNTTSDRDFGFQILDSSTGLEIFNSGPIAKVKSTIGAPDPNKFNITLDYRLVDPVNNLISPTTKQAIREVADEFETVVKESSRTGLKGNVKTSLSTPIISFDASGTYAEKLRGFGYRFPNNVEKLPYNHIFNEYLDDFTVLVSDVSYMYDIQGNSFFNDYAFAQTGHLVFNNTPYTENGSSVTPNPSFNFPNVIFLALNLKDLQNERPNQLSFGSPSGSKVKTYQFIKNTIRHEMMHAFGSVNKIYPDNNPNYNQANFLTTCQSNQTCYTGPISVAQNGGQPLLMNGDSHLDMSLINSSVITRFMQPNGDTVNYPLKALDKAILADNGFCVDGVSASNCN
jgi:hypothetical protein